VGEAVALQVIDNGQGFDADHTDGSLGHGLSNMSERARHVGASLEVVSSPGEGTTVTVRLPNEKQGSGYQAARDLSSAVS
jgi:signal transduction histidine kinase